MLFIYLVFDVSRLPTLSSFCETFSTGLFDTFCCSIASLNFLQNETIVLYVGLIREKREHETKAIFRHIIQHDAIWK